MANTDKRPLPKRTPIVGPNPPWAQANTPANDARPNCVSLLQCSEQFMRSCRALEAADSYGFFLESYPVGDYLVGHGLEQVLKAFLATRGWNVGDLKRLNHDLEVTLKAAIEAGLREYVPVSTDEELTLMTLNVPYASKHLEYLDTGHSGMFSGHETLLQLAMRLHDGLWEVSAIADLEADDPDDAEIFRADFTRWRERETAAGGLLRVAHVSMGAGSVGFFETTLGDRCGFENATFYLIQMDSGWRGAGSLEPRDYRDGFEAWLARRGLRVRAEGAAAAAVTRPEGDPSR